MPPPKTLPANFFDAPQSEAPKTLPPDFFNDPKNLAPMGSKGWVKDREKKNQENLKRYTTPEDPGAMKGLSDTISPSAIIGGIASAALHPVDTVSGLFGQQVEMGRKAGESFAKGDYQDAAARGMATALPLMGPAAYEAGADIRDGRTGYGIGKGLGLVAGTLLPGAIKKAANTAPAMTIRNMAADTLRTSAEKQYGQVLNPTTRGLKKVTENRIVPQLIERRETYRSLKSLKDNASKRVENLGAQIGDYWNSMPDDALAPVSEIIDRVKAEAENIHTIAGPGGKRVPLGDIGAQGVASAKSLASTLEEASVIDPSTGVRQIPVKRLREVRQYFDDVAARGKRYQGADLAEAGKAETYGRVADAIREEFAKADPSLDVLNKEFSFWKNVEKVAEETVTRRVGQAKPLTRQMGELAGATAGAVSGGPVGAVVGSKSLGMLLSLTQSTAWRTISAVTKDKLANALSKGQKGTAQAYINQMVKEADASPGQPTLKAIGTASQQPGGSRP